MGGMTVSFNEATRGHTIGIRNPTFKDDRGNHPWKTWKIFCTCGWESERPKVWNFDPKAKKDRQVLMPMEDFRALGQRHLYEVWQESPYQRPKLELVEGGG